MLRGLAFAVLVACTGAFSAAAEPLKPGASLAFFGLTFIDTSTEGAIMGAREDEAARMEMLQAYVVAQFTERGFNFLDTAPVHEEINRIANPADCNGCEVRAAAKLGADYSVVGEVQKVSNLILSMNLVVRHAADGAFAKGQSVEIRGNNDNSWRRGMRYILRNNVFKD